MTALIILTWLAICFVVGYVAHSEGRSFGSYFVISLLLSPLIGFIILLIKGKASQYEILNENKHIFYCPKCNSVYSGLGNKQEYCEKCGNPLDETVILRDDWRDYSMERKDYLKAEFAKHQHMRYDSSNIQLGAIQGSGAEEIKKYKELLDAGAITQEEYAAKKKQILNL